MTAPLIALMQEQGIKSLDELARRLCEVKTTEKWPAARSVSAKLGLLSKDEAEWWLKRPAFIDACQCRFKTDTLFRRLPT